MSRNYGGTMVANLFVKFGADTEEYQKKMRAAVTRMLFAAESLTQAGRIMSTAITAPMIMVGAASLKTAMQFESAMTRMVSLVGMPAETIARWKPVVQDMAGVVGKSANELAEALFFITSNGIRTDEALKVLEATSKASAIGLGETKDVAIAATSALNAYGEGALTANESVAVLIGTIREGNLEAVELPSALSRLLPVASSLGIAFHEAGAGIAAMSRSGTSARLAAFGMRAIMLGLEGPTDSATKAIEKMELSVAGLRAQMGTEGLWSTMQTINQAIEEHGMSLRDVFTNQKAYVAALQLLGKNVEANTEIFANMAEVVGEDVEKGFQDAAHTMERDFKRGMGALSSAAIDLGNNLAPLVTDFKDLAFGAASLARGFDELSDYSKGLVSSIAFIVMATGPVLYALGSLARITARFTGLSILFKLSWVQNAAAMMKANLAATQLGTKLTGLGVSWKAAGGGMLMALGVGWQIGKWMDKQLGITKFFNEELGTFGSAIDSVGEALEENAEKMWNYTNASHRLAMAIGEVNLAHELSDARAAGNSRKVAKLTAEIEKKANAYNAVRIKVDGATKAEEEYADKQKILADAQEELAAAEEERLKKLRESHNLMTSDEVTDKMHEITSTYQKHIDAGVSRNRVNKEMVTDTKEVVEWMREYGIAASDAFKEMAASMNETGDIKNNEFFKLFDYYIPQAINAIPGEVIEGMVKIETGVAESLSGGFDRGFAEGTDKYALYDQKLQDALNATWQGGFAGFGSALRDQVDQILDGDFTVKVKPDQEYFNEKMLDLYDGNIPDTRG